MSLLLDGMVVPGVNRKTTITLPFEDEDVTGALSGTTTADKGLKGKRMTVSLDIPFTKQKELKQLSNLAEATSKSGDRHIYRLTEPAASAMSFTQAFFSGDFIVAEQEPKQVWRVTFELKEHLSLQEKKKQREELEPAERANVETDVETPKIPVDIELNSVERFLQSIDQTIGPASEV